MTDPKEEPSLQIALSPWLMSRWSKSVPTKLPEIFTLPCEFQPPCSCCLFMAHFSVCNPVGWFWRSVCLASPTSCEAPWRQGYRSVLQHCVVKTSISEDFPDGSVDKNLPANAGDMSLIDPWPGKIPDALGQPSLCSTMGEAASRRNLCTATRVVPARCK